MKLKDAFIGSDGKLRPIWRAVIYYALGTWIVFPFLDWPFSLAAKSLHLSPGLTAANIGLSEFETLLVAPICTGAFALYERRRVDSYGLPSIALSAGRHSKVRLPASLWRGRRHRDDCAGRHADQRIRKQRQRARVLRACLARREYLYRRRRGILFSLLFPADALEKHRLLAGLHCHSAYFAAEHYFFKQGENIWDVITLVSLSML